MAGPADARAEYAVDLVLHKGINDKVRPSPSPSWKLHDRLPPPYAPPCTVPCTVPGIRSGRQHAALERARPGGEGDREGRAAAVHARGRLRPSFCQ
mmetsp:Transcript_22308/g.69417  ORF Transcript_22308/g.69417 Transcript_22308/m.69417 type:complete len:96 (+) Transcript_22308:208-495(+)